VDYWVIIAVMGALSMMLWGWFHQQKRLRLSAVNPSAVFRGSSGTVSPYNELPAAHSVLNDLIPMSQADWSGLWNLKLHTHQQWEDFKAEYNRCIPGFLPNLRLEYPQLTQSDIRIACLLRMGMTSNEISKVQNISVQGVAMARYRLRKRMGLSPGDCISDKLNELGSAMGSTEIKLRISQGRT